MSITTPSPESVSRRVAIFRNGRNQAIRIPRDFEFQADEVMVLKEGDRLVLEPIMKEPSLLETLAMLDIWAAFS